ncbi:Flp pilus assembly protein CpaB [Virgibacillus phasianinus]|uniref:Flp pilus assembly protein CpaB n=1 Tax=Virgibacillus phasianinus TaxID=2017483 RepID=A0A220U126_9BACI|nr:Flp pilus assembly protein CpaB [Virgibacillus phasianinus]ASK61828.1 Flp pilus assembly protein CpaB [Virgibacillus phasianinus]
MTTKKIWLIAMVFGIIAAGLLYVMVINNENQSAIPARATASDDVKEKEADQKKEEEMKAEEANEFDLKSEKVTGNEMIPVSDGNRAMTIAVNDVQGVSGNIEPGSHIDVVAVMKAPEKKSKEQHDSATLLLQNAKVLAIGHAADDEETKKRYQMITVEVSPKEGLTLGFATRYDLYVMLRKDGDKKLEPDHTHIHEDDLHEGVFK